MRLFQFDRAGGIACHDRQLGQIEQGLTLQLEQGVPDLEGLRGIGKRQYGQVVHGLEGRGRS